MSSSLKLLCNNGKPADLLYDFDASQISSPVDQMRFYYTDKPAEPDLIASYIDGLLPAGNMYNINIDKDKKNAEVLIPIIPTEHGHDMKFKHFVLYSYKDSSGQRVIASTRDVDSKQWNKEFHCESDWLSMDTHPYNRKQSLIIGLSAAIGSLLIMLMILATCCCVRKQRKTRAQIDADRIYYEEHYGRDDNYDEFAIKSNQFKPQTKKVSATTEYLKKYYKGLSSVKEEHRRLSEEDGDAHVVDDETII